MGHWPESRIRSPSSKNWLNSTSTACAVVGDTAPNLFALGAAIPDPPKASNSFNKFKAIC